MEKVFQCEQHQAQELLGDLQFTSNLLAHDLGVRTVIDAEGLRLIGIEQQVVKAESVYRQLLERLKLNLPIDEQAVRYLLDEMPQNNSESDFATNDFAPNFIAVTAKGRPLYSKTLGQQHYIQAIEKHDLTFAVGPAGTGKTYLAVAMAVKAFRAHQVSRIILTRPAVEAGEKLGFLPGDLQMKVDPYMRPLYDALHDLMGSEQYQLNMDKGLIEVSPLAYMRGRTLDDAFIILDEAQNTTPEQMKMFLTRIGFHSKVIVTGDITQVDLPSTQKSGLVNLERVLGEVEGVKFIQLTARDVVRNPLVQRIIKAYEQAQKKR